ncbi:MAG: hypothetical protein AAGA85_26950, partial [Bacteroidota bacterium]
LLVSSVHLLQAQSGKEEVEFIQSVFGMEKRAIVADFIDLDGDAADAFWTAYEEYETGRKALGQGRIQLLKDYADNYDGLTDDKIKELAMASAKQRSSRDKLMLKTFKKMSKTAGVKAAGQFYQIERYFESIIQAQILESIPFIGELDD